MMIPGSLDDFKKTLSDICGLAPKDGVHCVKCRQKFSDKNVQTPAGWRETKISGYCENCWNELFSEGDGDDD